MASSTLPDNTEPDNTEPIETVAIETSRLTFHCRVTGDPENMPILLVHGSFATSRWWEPFMRLLADGFYIVAPDLRGCGNTWASTQKQTDTPPVQDHAGQYAIEAQAQDIAALVEALGWSEFDLVGHSSGGAIGMEYALSLPDRLRTLTLVDSAPVEGVFTPTDMLMLLDQMRTDRELLRNALAALMPSYPTGMQAEDAAPESDSEEGRGRSNHVEENARTQAMRILRADAPMASVRFFEQLVDDAMHMAPTAYTAVAEALNRWNRFADAGQLTLPTLLVWGELDRVVDRDTTTRMLIAIPGANNLEVIRNVGHSPMLEAPIALAERFVEFVTDDLDDFEQVRRDAL